MQRRHRALVSDIDIDPSLRKPFKEHVDGFGTVYGVVVRPGTLWFNYIQEVHRLLCKHPTRAYAQWWHGPGLGGICMYIGAFDSDAHFHAFLDNNPSSRAVVERFAPGRLFVHAIWAPGASVLPSDCVASAVLRGHRFEYDSFPNRVICRRIFPMTDAEIRSVVAHPHHTLTFDVFRDPEALTLARFRHPSQEDGDDEDLVVINRRWGIESRFHLAQATTIPDVRTIALPRAPARVRESDSGHGRCCVVS